MDMIKIELGGDEYEFPRYRTQDIFESFPNYAVSCLLGVYIGPREDIITTRCLLSGFQVARLVDSEVEQMIRQAIVVHRLERLEEQLPLSDSDHIGAFELIWQHIERRMVDICKVAPSVTFSKDRLALAHQPWDRQLSILLGMLLFDAGMFRESTMDYEERHARILQTWDLADHISLIESFDMVDQLHAALVELDAKYAIKKLTLTRKEKDMIESIRSAEYIDFDEVLPFVLKMIAYRDDTAAVVVDESGTTVWSKQVYTSRTFEAIERTDFSNIFKAPSQGSKPKVEKNPDGTRKNPVGRPRKPVSPEVQAAKEVKEARKSVALGALDSIFGNLNLGGKK